jgi:pSer/pThr/pTyr-binding forkhead associated (FHA) protein
MLEPRPALPPRDGGEEAYRPSIRSPVPRLTILDDGESLSGETVRLRGAATVIGRTEGQILLVHDPLVSSRHAEILREGAGRPYHWVLRDLGSCNGTFVSCGRTELRPDRLLMLGSRRFRFRPAALMVSPQAIDLIGESVAAAVWPALVETSQPGAAAEILLSGTDLVMGRPGCGNQVEIDDPCLAERHARIVCDSQGRWHLEALPSKNGVWVQVSAIRLTAVCRFQVGEQRFLFTI